MDRAARLWKESHPIAGTIGERYFRNRGLTLELPPTLRFHPRAWHGYDKRELPCIVGAVTDVDDKLSAVWRIYLNDDGSGKADVRPQRLGLGPTKGGAVRLTPPATRSSSAASSLGLSEGVENGLAIAQSCPDREVWATLMVRNLSPALSDNIREVVLALDGDADGSDAFIASEKAIQALIARGLIVRVWRAPAGMDANDVLRLPQNVMPFDMRRARHS